MRRIKKGNGREVFKRFEKELHTLRKLSHDHLVTVKGSYTDLNYVALLMTPVADCNLKKYLQQPLPDRDKPVFRTYYGCLTNAVRYLKDSQIRHNDIKPENILLHNQHIYITDFGTALDWSGTEFSNSVTKGNITSVTPRYQSPEVHSGAPRRSSNDIWSLGVVFLEMTTILRGKTLKSLEDHLERHGTGNSYVFQNLDAAISWFRVLQPMPGLSDNTPLQWIKEMISKDPINRRTAADLFEDMSEADGGIWCGRCCKELESESESMPDTDEDTDNTIQPILSAPVQNEEVMEPGPSLYFLQPVTRTEEYAHQGSEMVIEPEEEAKNTNQVSKPNFQYAVPSPYTYYDYQQQVLTECNTQLLPGAFPEETDEKLPLVIRVEPCTYDAAPVVEKHKDISFQPEPSNLHWPLTEAPVQDNIQFQPVVKENKDVPLQPDTSNLPWPLTEAPVQDNIQFQPVVEENKDISFQPEPSNFHWLLTEATLQDNIQFAPVVEENEDLPIQPDTSKLPWPLTEAPVQDDIQFQPVVEENKDVSLQPDTPNLPWPLTEAPVQENIQFQPIVEENKDVPLQTDTPNLPWPLAEAPVQENIQFTPFSQFIWTKSDDIHTSPSYILQNSVCRRRSYDNLNHISAALIQNMSLVDNDRLRRSTSYESLQDDYENPVPDIFLRIKEELLSFRLDPIWADKHFKTEKTANSSEPAKDENPKYQTESITEKIQEPRLPNSSVAFLDVVSTEEPEELPPPSYEELPQEIIKRTAPLPSATTMLATEENDLKKWLNNMRAPPSSPGNNSTVLEGLRINKKAPQPTNITVRGPQVSLPLTAENLEDLIHKPQANEKIKPVNASVYMKKIWDDAASSAPTSVMSSRTAKRFSSAGVFLPMQDKTLNFLGQYTKEGKVSAVRVLLKAGCNPGKKMNPRWEPIFNAVRGASDRHTKCVRELINYGVDVNAKNKVSKRTPLHYAIEHEVWSGYSNLIYILLAAGADPNIKDAMGDVPLLQILYGGNEPLPKHRRDALALLLAPNYNTDVNVSPPGTMNRPLHLAVRRKDPWAVGMLLEKNVPVDGKNGAGLTPLQLAMGSWTAMINYDQLEILRLLLEKNADVNVKNETDGRTPLHIAVSLEIIDAVRMLLQHGAKRNIEEKRGKTARQLYEEQAKTHKNCKKCPEIKKLMDDRQTLKGKEGKDIP
jgi:serine/threonine protein kinase/ankyrin repeat protein